MTVLAAAWVLGVGLAAQPAKTFQDKDLGLSFQYPAEWKLRRERLFSAFDVPLEGGRTAEIRIINTPFRQRPDAWQKAQADVAGTLNRVVERQWEEVILGVPLLMTKLSYMDGERPMNVLIGMIYSRAELKLTFRATTPADAYEMIESKWRETLNSLRTLSGAMPDVEDPSKPPATTPTARQDEPKVAVLRPLPAKIRLNKRDQIVPMDVLGQQLSLRVPQGWTLDRTPEGAFQLKHEKLGAPLPLDFGAGTAVDMGRAVLAASNQHSSKFVKIDLRTETPPRTNRSGATLFSVRRNGAGADGFLLSLVNGGHAGLYYWTTSYTAASERIARKEEGLLRDLHETLLLGPRS